MDNTQWMGIGLIAVVVLGMALMIRREVRRQKDEEQAMRQRIAQRKLKYLTRHSQGS